MKRTVFASELPLTAGPGSGLGSGSPRGRGRWQYLHCSAHCTLCPQRLPPTPMMGPIRITKVPASVMKGCVDASNLAVVGQQALWALE